MNISSIKAPAPMPTHIKSIDLLDLENRIRRSPLFTDPAAAADEYLAQIDTMKSHPCEAFDVMDCRRIGNSPMRRWRRSLGGDGSKGNEK